MKVEKLIHTEFEQLLPHEIERKYLPVDPSVVDQYRDQAAPIEQVYLSHPSEPFSLRLRSDYDERGHPRYMVALKDGGTLTASGLDRLEVEAPLDAQTYCGYMSPDLPVVRKLRAQPLDGISIDYYENGSVIVESENDESWRQFTERHGDMFAEITGDRQADNEWVAHLEFRRINNGSDTLKPSSELEPSDITHDILSQRRLGQSPVVVHIGGRSGSGKSTIVHQVVQELDALKLTSVTLSTDDYHRGEPWLIDHNGDEPWTKWDDPIVYDTQSLAIDIARLLRGEAIPRRCIDWKTVVPMYDGEIEPADVIIVEGIYARAPEITGDTDLQYEMSTGLATCVGRRLLRDIRERPEFSDPVKSLKYMIEEAEPAYRQQVAHRQELL